MKRSALALGASVLALALTAGPAAADPGVGQVVGDSTAAAQVEPYRSTRPFAYSATATARRPVRAPAVRKRQQRRRAGRRSRPRTSTPRCGC